MPTNEEIQTAKNVLHAAGFIAVYWCKEDIIGAGVELDIELTEKEIDEVRQTIEFTFDAELGVSWDTVFNAVRELKET